MRALVLGATGHLGNALSRALLDSGASVTVCTRTVDKQTANLAGLDVAIIRGDRSNAADMQRIVAGHDIVVDAAAPYPVESLLPWQLLEFPAANDGRLHDEALQHTRQLLDIVRRQAAGYVYISSFTTLPRARSGVGRIAAQYRRLVAPYFQLKYRLEEEVRKASAAGLPVIILNPSLCLGPWELTDNADRPSLVQTLLQSPMLVSVRDEVNVVDVRDVAACAVAAIEKGCFGASTLISGHNIQIDQLFEKVFCYRSKPPVTVPSLSALNAVASYWLETVNRVSGKMVPVPPAIAALLLCECYPMQVSSLQQYLGVPLHTVDNTIEDSVTWLQSA